MPIRKASNRLVIITTADHGKHVEIGPGSAMQFVGTMVLQFNPDVAFVGSFAVLARLTGAAAESVNLPFMPVPYRRVTINNVASDYAFTGDLISTPSKIQIPSNMDSIALLVDCTAGSCSIVCWDLQGPSMS